MLMSDPTIFLSRGTEFATSAVESDNLQHYVRAETLYQRAVEYLLMYCKQVSPTVSRHIKPRIQGYLARAEAIKKMLDSIKTHKIENSFSDVGVPSSNEKSKSEQTEDIDVDVELRKVVGMDLIKKEIQTMRRELLLDKRRVDLGLEVAKPMPPHMSFCGNPGTGKTKIARLIGKIFRQLGVVEKGHLVEVQRADLVAGFVGQTATKTRKIIESAKGGVLFIDEAYRLLPQKADAKDFGTEAIEELMSVMTAGDPVIIFAGYKKDMEDFFSSNAGLFRRVQRHFNFVDYTCAELAQITYLVVKSKGFRFPSDMHESELRDLIEEHTTASQRSAFNGAIGSRIFELAKRSLDRRLSLKASAEALITFSRLDVVTALRNIPIPPPGVVRSLTISSGNTPPCDGGTKRSEMSGGIGNASSEDDAFEPSELKIPMSVARKDT